MILRCIGHSRFLLLSAPSCDNMSSATDIFQITIIAKQLSTNPPSFCDTLQMCDYLSETFLFERCVNFVLNRCLAKRWGIEKEMPLCFTRSHICHADREKGKPQFLRLLVFAQICDFFTRIGANIKITF